MNKNIRELYTIANKQERLIIGLMSGTSLDGLDIALCRVSGNGTSTKIQVLNFETITYNDDFKKEVRSVFSKKKVDLEKLCLLNAWIGTQHASLIRTALKKWNIATGEVDIIASHGQTIYHAPKNLHQQDIFPNATLQIGDGDHIAVNTGIITISDFRQKHIAAGGEGAPLAMYGDYILFSKEGENRIMLNIGGIGNFTYLPANQSFNEIVCTDTGPGNTLMDTYVQKFFPDKYFDEDAALAKQGNINIPLLKALQDNIFFALPFPKTTGPELFNFEYIESAIQKAGTHHLSHFDILATLNYFTAETISNAIKSVCSTINNTSVFVSGGGAHNTLLINNLYKILPGMVIKDIKELNINPDAKEAILFAVLANECLCGNGLNRKDSNIPDITMGKISFPW